MLQPLKLGCGSSQALISAKGTGSHFTPFNLSTGNAYENPNPFLSSNSTNPMSGGSRGSVT